MNATLVGQCIILFALIMGAICYYVGRRKTQTPLLSALLGTVLSIMPPFGLVYLVALVLKKDLTSALPE
jgi:FtsH-binding integral membrane protein